MPNPVWPLDVPTKILINSQGETPQPNRAESTMDDGEPHYRQIHSLMPMVLAGSIVMTKAQYATFKEWYKSSLQSMVLPFDDFPHPTTGENLTDVRLVGVGTAKPLSEKYMEIPITLRWLE